MFVLLKKTEADPPPEQAAIGVGLKNKRLTYTVSLSGVQFVITY
jgi:hypothetical protein